MKHLLALITAMIIHLTSIPLAQASIFDLNCSSENGTSVDFAFDTNDKTVIVDFPHFQVWTLMWNDQHISWVMKLEIPLGNSVTVLSYLLERESGVLIASALLADDAAEPRGFAFEYLCRRPI